MARTRIKSSRDRCLKARFQQPPNAKSPGHNSISKLQYQGCSLKLCRKRKLSQSTRSKKRSWRRGQTALPRVCLLCLVRSSIRPFRKNGKVLFPRTQTLPLFKTQHHAMPIFWLECGTTWLLLLTYNVSWPDHVGASGGWKIHVLHM